MSDSAFEETVALWQPHNKKRGLHVHACCAALKQNLWRGLVLQARQVILNTYAGKLYKKAQPKNYSMFACVTLCFMCFTLRWWTEARGTNVPIKATHISAEEKVKRVNTAHVNNLGAKYE